MRNLTLAGLMTLAPIALAAPGLLLTAPLVPERSRFSAGFLLSAWGFVPELASRSPRFVFAGLARNADIWASPTTSKNIPIPQIAAPTQAIQLRGPVANMPTTYTIATMNITTSWKA